MPVVLSITCEFSSKCQSCLLDNCSFFERGGVGFCLPNPVGASVEGIFDMFLEGPKPAEVADVECRFATGKVFPPSTQFPDGAKGNETGFSLWIILPIILGILAVLGLVLVYLKRNDVGFWQRAWATFTGYCHTVRNAAVPQHEPPQRRYPLLRRPQPVQQVVPPRPPPPALLIVPPQQQQQNIRPVPPARPPLPANRPLALLNPFHPFYWARDSQPDAVLEQPVSPGSSYHSAEEEEGLEERDAVENGEHEDGNGGDDENAHDHDDENDDDENDHDDDENDHDDDDNEPDDEDNGHDDDKNEQNENAHATPPIRPLRRSERQRKKTQRYGN